MVHYRGDAHLGPETRRSAESASPATFGRLRHLLFVPPCSAHVGTRRNQRSTPLRGGVRDWTAVRVPAWARGSTNLFPIASTLSETYSVLRFDFEGSGKSPLCSEGLSVGKFVEDVKTVLASSGFEGTRAIIYGQSLGAAVSILLRLVMQYQILKHLGCASFRRHISGARSKFNPVLSRGRKTGQPGSAGAVPRNGQNCTIEGNIQHGRLQLYVSMPS